MPEIEEPDDIDPADDVDVPDEPDVEEPDVEEPDVEEPDVEEPDVEEPDVEEPDVEEPDVEEIGSDNSGPSSESAADDSSSGSSEDNSGPGGGGSDSSGSSEEGSGEDNSGSSGSSHDDSSGSSGPSENSGRSEDLSAEQFAAREDILLERDYFDDERIAREALFSAAPSDLAAAQRAGFALISETQLAALDRRVARLRAPPGMGVDQAVSILRSLAPDAIVAPNGVYRNAQAGASARAIGGLAAPAASGLLGIIDTGVDAAVLGAPAAVLNQRAFTGAAPVAREHGTIVAALAADHGMRVRVADVFRVDANGRAFASSDAIAAALDWLIASNVPVINISIEGPNNALLGALVQRAAERGQIIVAAAGNGGPLARPSFPAAFNGSVAVTAIDGDDRPYMRANRGEYIAFAAPGVDLRVRTSAGSVVVSGTSFAAPVVAARIARQLQAPSPENARAVLSALQRQAVDLGEPGRDPVFGWGALRD